jgi:hypothetical protein
LEPFVLQVGVVDNNYLQVGRQRLTYLLDQLKHPAYRQPIAIAYLLIANNSTSRG